MYAIHQFDDESDSILGLGNKKKKAEKKLKKAEKQIAAGHTKKGEKKLDKAIKKGAQMKQGDTPGDNPLTDRIKTDLANVHSEEKKQNDFSAQFQPKAAATPDNTVPMAGIGLDPITKQDSTAVLGSGSSVPMQSSSGGGMGGGGGSDMSDMVSQDYQASQQSLSTPENPVIGEEAIVSSTIPADKKPFPWIYVIIGAALLIGVVYFVTRKKSS